MKEPTQTILLLSDPFEPVADKLLEEENIYKIIFVTPSNVYLRTKADEVRSGQDINVDSNCEINVSLLKKRILYGYPLIDRWMLNRRYMWQQITQLLEYTISLIKIIKTHKPNIAVLETGAPHHLFTYCLDLALEYTSTPKYYLYGNSVDSKCIVFENHIKTKVISTTKYKADRAVKDLIAEIKANTSYRPKDSIGSLAPKLHHNFIYPISLWITRRLAKFLHRGIGVIDGGKSDKSVRAIGLPNLQPKLIELISISFAQYRYLKAINTVAIENISEVSGIDIVYVGHMVPEATSFPESFDYPEEIDVLLDLKHRFPDSKVFYREHPAIGLYSEFGHVHMQGIYKNIGFLKVLQDHQIQVVHPSVPMDLLRQRGCLFATKTGRVAIENSVLEHTTIIYGNPFYGTDLPFNISIRHLGNGCSVEKLKQTLKDSSHTQLAVQERLAARFSGAITNPGIGLGPVHDKQILQQYQLEFTNLVKCLLQMQSPKTLINLGMKADC